MASGQSAEGRRVVISVRLSEAEAAEVDAARGAFGREAWMRAAVLTAARERAAQQKAKRDPKACPPHPRRRVNKGLCGSCGRSVGDEKVA